MNKKAFKQFFHKIRTVFAVLGVFLVFVVSILPTTNVSADNDAIGLGNFLPACQVTSTGVPSLLECISQITYQVLLLGIVTFFARSAYLAIISLTSGNAVKYVMESVGSLFVGIIFIGLPVAIMGMINPLSETLSIRFFQEFNLGPDAQLEDVSPIIEISGCRRFYICIDNCIKQSTDKEKCIEGCIQSNSNSQEECSSECVGYMQEYLEEYLTQQQRSRYKLPFNPREFIEKCIITSEPSTDQTNNQTNP